MNTKKSSQNVDEYISFVKELVLHLQMDDYDDAIKLARLDREARKLLGVKSIGRVSFKDR